MAMRNSTWAFSMRAATRPRPRNGTGSPAWWPIPQNYAVAIEWYQLAADQGYADAQSKIGAMYSIGQGVRQNYVTGHMWLDLAAAQGNEDARRNRDLVAAKMTPAQIAEAQKRAAEWQPRR